MSEPTEQIEMHFHPTTNSFHEVPAEDSWSILLPQRFRWYFTDMDSNAEITLHPLSAMEVEAGYQAHRAYLTSLNNPHGQEGEELCPPPKEIKVGRGFYAGKKYRVSFSIVAAARISKCPVKDKSGNLHVEVYQQNSQTGFMRTLYRTPVESKAKSFSRLRVESTCNLDSVAGRISKMHIDVRSGKSFFGYRYPRTRFTLAFPPEEKDLAQMMHDLYLDDELFRLEVPRDENSGSLFPIPDGRAANLIVKQSVFEAGLKVQQVESQVVGDMDDEISVRIQGNNVPVEGEPDVEELCDEKIGEEIQSRLSKFDVYSFVDRVRRASYKEDNYSQYILDNMEEESLPEYVAHHVGTPRGEKQIQVPVDVFYAQLEQILAAKDDMTCIAFKNGCDPDEICVTSRLNDITVAKKDAIYNKLVSQIKTDMVALVSVKVSEMFRVEYGDEGHSEEAEENENSCQRSFVSYLGYEGKLLLLTPKNARTLSERFCSVA